jgi:hypothetical protein
MATAISRGLSSAAVGAGCTLRDRERHSIRVSVGLYAGSQSTGDHLHRVGVPYGPWQTITAGPF